MTLNRRDWLRSVATGVALMAATGCRESAARRRSNARDTMQRGDANKMPVLFVGHGSPMNVVEDNRWSRGFTALAGEIPRPRAILAISAHWYVTGTYLTSNEAPRTIHDFSGFPRALYEIEYPAPGNAKLAERVLTLVRSEPTSLRDDWGLDHGTWTVLRWMYPEADIPVIQLSINRRLTPQRHYELARSLAALRDEGVLIIGSGNIVHNLGDAIGQMGSSSPVTPPWAARFDDTVRKVLEQRDTTKLLSLWPDSDDGRKSHPSPDHWIPLIYAFGASDERDASRFANLGFDLGSISMTSVVFG